MTAGLPQEPGQRRAQDERLVELLTERAVYGLSDEQDRELRSLTGGEDGWREAEAFELAAAAAHVAMGPALMPMPSTLRMRLEAAADEFIAAWAGPAAQSATIAGRLGPAASRPAGAWFSWLAAAACLALAVSAWWPRLSGPAGGERASIAAVRSAPDALRLSWGDFNSLDERKEPPEIAGVKGEVVWSDALQRGVIRFENLPVNDPARERYQLWIVDAQRGLSQRVDGGLFDVTGPGACEVAVAGKLKVHQAIGFAVTIEKPDGAVVSDMARRVVLALKS